MIYPCDQYELFSYWLWFRISPQTSLHPSYPQGVRYGRSTHSKEVCDILIPTSSDSEETDNVNQLTPSLRRIKYAIEFRHFNYTPYLIEIYTKIYVHSKDQRRKLRASFDVEEANRKHRELVYNSFIQASRPKLKNNNDIAR